MDIEQTQAQSIDYFVKKVSVQVGSALGPVVPTVAELEGTENSVYLGILRLFAHGTWSDYKSNLETRYLLQVLPYDHLMLELDVTNVRELEDFIINECIYAGIVRGKLDQMRRCFEVQFASGRDLRPGQLGSMIQTLSNWLGTSDNLLISIQEKIKWADTMSESDKKHRKDVEDRVEEVKKSISVKVGLLQFSCKH
ncbi:hypothetical protein V6N13_045653 [Hibiscus sabdariffa]